jgi:hypothetical protein
MIVDAAMSLLAPDQVATRDSRRTVKALPCSIESNGVEPGSPPRAADQAAVRLVDFMHRRASSAFVDVGNNRLLQKPRQGANILHRPTAVGADRRIYVHDENRASK